jgi:hypothetical protein
MSTLQIIGNKSGLQLLHHSGTLKSAQVVEEVNYFLYSEHLELSLRASFAP